MLNKPINKYGHLETFVNFVKKKSLLLTFAKKINCTRKKRVYSTWSHTFVSGDSAKNQDINDFHRGQRVAQMKKFSFRFALNSTIVCTTHGIASRSFDETRLEISHTHTHSEGGGSI